MPLRLSPRVTLQDFSFKTFAFSSAKAVMRLLGEMVATLTGTPNIGLGLFVISTKLLRGGCGTCRWPIAPAMTACGELPDGAHRHSRADGDPQALRHARCL